MVLTHAIEVNKSTIECITRTNGILGYIPSAIKTTRKKKSANGKIACTSRAQVAPKTVCTHSANLSIRFSFFGVGCLEKSESEVQENVTHEPNWH